MSDKPTCMYYGEANDIHALITCVVRTMVKAGMEKEKFEYIRLIARDGNMFNGAMKISMNYVEFPEE